MGRGATALPSGCAAHQPFSRRRARARQEHNTASLARRRLCSPRGTGCCRRTASGRSAVDLFRVAPAPENVLAGHLTWTDYRPPNGPNAVRILHHKTDALVWLPLADQRGPLFPELTAYL